MISTSRQSAGGAIVPTICESLGYSVPAHARLRRSARVNLNQSSTGACSLVDEHCNEHRPSSIVDGLRQHSTGETLHVQILNGNHAVRVNQFARQFVLKVGPLVAHVDVGALEQPHSLASSVATLLPSSHLPLATAQARLRIPIV